MTTTKASQSIRFICLLIGLLLTACAETAPREEIISLATWTTTLPPSTTTPSPTAKATSTFVPTHTPTASPAETYTPTVTMTPSPTATPFATPVPPILSRQPSLEELESYLDGLALLWEPIYGHAVQTTYEDVNGDSEIDLIVADYLFVGVFLWRKDHYEGAFVYQGEPWKYDPGSQVTLADWTNDGVAEIVFDYREDNGGTGYRETVWSRYVIHCPELASECAIIWSGKSGELSEGYNTGEVSLWRADIAPVSDVNGRLAFNVVTESFATSFLLTETLQIYTSTLDSYVWNGSQFEWESTEILAPMRTVEAQPIIEKPLDETMWATVSARSNNDAGLLNDICQVMVNGQKSGLEFGCKSGFTSLDWQDVTGDGRSELTVVVYSNTYTGQGFEGEGYHQGKDCIHQRLLIFQNLDSVMSVIANVTGCVVESDLYGVRFEDLDQDGQVEILAADGWLTADRCFSTLSTSAPDGKQDNCWYELGYQDEVYRWNGTEFVYSGLLSE